VRALGVSELRDTELRIHRRTPDSIQQARARVDRAGKEKFIVSAKLSWGKWQVREIMDRTGHACAAQ